MIYLDVKLTDILLEIKNRLKSVYPISEIHFFNTTQSIERPSFLISPIINKTKKSNFYLLDTVLSIQVIGYMPLVNDRVGYEDKLILIDNLNNIFGDMNIEIKDRNLKFDYEIREVDEETLMILDFRFKDDRKVIVESYELMKQVLLNNKEGNIYG